jgi:hypothetical protein
VYTRENLTTFQQDVFATGLQQACQQVVTMLLFYRAIRLSLTTCREIVELQDDNKLLEQLVASLLSSTTLQQVVNKPLTTCQQAGNKQCEHILLTSCWNSIVTTCQQAGNKQCEHILLTSCWNSIVTTCQQAGNKPCEHILLTSCWNSIVTTCQQAGNKQCEHILLTEKKHI